MYSCRVIRGIIVHIVQKATVTNIICNAIYWFIVQSNLIAATSVISVQLGSTVLSDMFWIIMGRAHPLLLTAGHKIKKSPYKKIVKLHFWQFFKQFPCSKKYFWSFLKLQKMDFVKKNFVKLICLISRVFLPRLF